MSEEDGKREKETWKGKRSSCTARPCWGLVRVRSPAATQHPVPGELRLHTPTVRASALRCAVQSVYMACAVLLVTGLGEWDKTCVTYKCQPRELNTASSADALHMFLIVSFLYSPVVFPLTESKCSTALTRDCPHGPHQPGEGVLGDVPGGKGCTRTTQSMNEHILSWPPVSSTNRAAAAWRKEKGHIEKLEHMRGIRR